MRLLFSFLFLLTFSHASLSQVSQWTPIEKHRGHLYVPVIIEGIESRAMLDTGAQINAINSRFIGKHELALDKGRSMKIQGVFGVEKRKTFNNLTVNLYGNNFELNRVVDSDLGDHNRGMIIGAPFFASFIVQLDYPNNRMRVMTREVLDLRKRENVEIKRHKATGQPIVKVEVNGNTLWLLLDTGNNGGVLIDRRVASKLDLLDEVAGTGISKGINSVAVTETAIIDNFKIGPFELENVAVNFVADGFKSNASNELRETGSRISSSRQDGILGYDILKHFLITLDYKKGQAHFGLQ
jgi:predicted aspartyl protease